MMGAVASGPLLPTLVVYGYAVSRVIVGSPIPACRFDRSNIRRRPPEQDRPASRPAEMSPRKADWEVDLDAEVVQPTAIGGDRVER